MRVIKFFTGLAGLGALLVAVPVLTVGVGLLAWAGGDDQLTLPTVTMETSERAFVTEDIEVFAGDRDRFLPRIGEATITVTDDEAVFVGVGPSDRVAAFVDVPGARPGDQDFWVAADEGSTASLDWDVDTGTWSTVVMNADGDRGVDATVRAAIPTTPLRFAGAMLGAIGLSIGVAGAVLVATAWGGGARPAPVGPATGAVTSQG